ncbi:hypothetical protein [Streptomyces sp. bgisy031]|uniref:hypothetical protein n=1 Tax=Streptomyces sp. bgisy031 TaxID=3413772 RepID=UPI003D75D682
MLGMLGIPPEQERLYVTLVAHPDSSLAELAELTGSADAAQDAVAAQLSELIASGLVVAEVRDLASADSAPRFRAASPSVALTPMLLHRRTMLDRTEAAVLALAEQHRHATSPAAGGVVEVVHGAEATRHRAGAGVLGSQNRGSTRHLPADVGMPSALPDGARG